MSHMSLSPFLVSLEGDDFRLTVRDYERVALALSAGGDWNLKRLRLVLISLLARDMDQRLSLMNRFDEFFAHSLTQPSSCLTFDINRFREEIDSLTHQDKVRFRRRTQKAPSSPAGTAPAPEQVVVKRRFWVPMLLFFLVLLLFLRSPQSVEPERVFESSGTEELTPLPAPDLPQEEMLPLLPDTQPTTQPSSQSRALRRLYTKVPSAEVLPQPDPFSSFLNKGILSAGLLFLVLAGYATWLWQSRKPPDDKAPEWRTDKDRQFHRELIGGEPAPRFDDPTLSRLADSMGYFQSSEVGQNLDVPASVEATGKNGGIPSLVFKKPKHLRSIIILVDRFADSLAGNPIPGELAVGLSRLGVPLIYGGFFGSPELFTTDTGTSIYLEDLESDRNRYLLLIFSDGKSLFNHRRALETLARWPMVAWMELRTRDHWDKGTVLPVNYGLAVYPATVDGVIKAVARHTTERGSSRKPNIDVANWQGIPARGERELGEYVEALLGDALPWAQACAMSQPIGPGLADAVRRRFYPTIPADHMELLYSLPGTTRNVAGLRFGLPVLAVLRSGFMIRRSEQEQVDVLEYLLALIDAAEPEDGDSPAHLSWEWVRERLNLELAPDQALKRLGELSKTPLKGLIKAEFATVAGGSAPEDQIKVPLRVAPLQNQSKQRLGQLIGKPMVVMPLSRLQRFSVAALSLGFLVALSFSAYFYRLSNRHPGLIQFNYASMEDTFARVERLENDLWTTEAFGALASLPRLNLPRDSTWRLSLFSNGHTLIGEPHSFADPVLVTVQAEPVREACREDFPKIGLTLLRCPDLIDVGEEITATNWREALGAQTRNRLFSVGLSLSQDPVDSHGANFQLLWDGNAIDLLFLVSPGSDGLFHLPAVVTQMEEQLQPWLDRTQLLGLLDSSQPELINAEVLLNLFANKPESAILIEPDAQFNWPSFLADHATVDTAGVLHLSSAVQGQVVTANGAADLLLPERTYERVHGTLRKQFNLALSGNDLDVAQEILHKLTKLGAPVVTEKQRLLAQLASRPVAKVDPPALQVPEKPPTFRKTVTQVRSEAPSAGVTVSREATASKERDKKEKEAVQRRLQQRIADLRAQFRQTLARQDTAAAGGLLARLKKLTTKTSNEEKSLKSLRISLLEDQFDQAFQAKNNTAMNKVIGQFQGQWPGDVLPGKWSRWAEATEGNRREKMRALRAELRFANLAVDPERARSSLDAIEAMGVDTTEERKKLTALEVHLGPLLKRIGAWTPARIRQLGLHYYFGTGGYAKDPKKGVFLLRTGAEGGDSQACFRFYMWSLEMGAESNSEEAVAWFQKEARSGDPPAQSALGLIYANGLGVDIDQSKAATWYRKAAEQGNPYAQVQLGLMYAQGNGVEKSDLDALKWLRSAADQNYASALLELGKIYYQGQGVSTDHQEALKLFSRAAKRGARLAQYRLGLMYAAGEGTSRNEKKAVEWFRKAAQRGHQGARDALAERNKKWTGITSSPTAKPVVYVFLPYHEYSTEVLRKRLQKRVSKLQFSVFASHRELTRAIRTYPPDAVLARPLSLVGDGLAVFHPRLIGHRDGLSNERLHLVRPAGSKDVQRNNDLALLDMGGRAEMQKMLKLENLTLVTEMSTLVSLFAAREVGKVLIPDGSLQPFGKRVKRRVADLESAEFHLNLELPVIAVNARSSSGDKVIQAMSSTRSGTLSLIYIQNWEKVDP